MTQNKYSGNATPFVVIKGQQCLLNSVVESNINYMYRGSGFKFSFEVFV